MASKITTFLTIFLLTIHTSLGTGGIFQLQLKSKSSCCSTTTTTTSPYNQSCCPQKLHICIKNYQINIDNLNCYIGESWTNLTDSTFNYEFKFRWPGTFSLIIETWNNNNVVDRVAIQKYLDINNEWKVNYYNGTSEIEYKYRVVCLKNYYGNNCNKYCKARDDKFGHYYCELESGEIKCLQGWEGEYCEKATCSSTCSNLHGYCVKPNECLCHSGWTGPDCKECKQYPGCKNGKCVKSWECECYEGWGGLFCNQDLNYCTNHRPCRNDGVCFNTGQGSYTCECGAGWVGVDCEISSGSNGSGGFNGSLGGGGNNRQVVEDPLVDFCRTHPCANGGTCYAKSTSYTCKCPLGFTGPDCSCQCLNGGSCDSKSNCICPPNFYGPKCSQITSNFTLGMIKQIISNEEELTNEHIIFIIIASISIPFLILFSISVILVMKKRRILELERNERIAKEQNEINTINNINKLKDCYIGNNIYKNNINNAMRRDFGTLETVASEDAINEGVERGRQREVVRDKNVNYSYQPDSNTSCSNSDTGGGGQHEDDYNIYTKLATQV